MNDKDRPATGGRFQPRDEDFFPGDDVRGHCSRWGFDTPPTEPAGDVEAHGGIRAGALPTHEDTEGHASAGGEGNTETPAAGQDKHDHHDNAQDEREDTQGHSGSYKF